MNWIQPGICQWFVAIRAVFAAPCFQSLTGEKKKTELKLLRGEKGEFRAHAPNQRGAEAG